MSSDFERSLEHYADLAINVGLNLQPGQRLLLISAIDAAPLARQIARSAYQAGARLVDVAWDDERLDLIRFQSAPPDSFEEFGAWRPRRLLEYVERGDAVLQIEAEDPELLQKQDAKAMALARKPA
jgi:aminopeptidase